MTSDLERLRRFEPVIRLTPGEHGSAVRWVKRSTAGLVQVGVELLAELGDLLLRPARRL